jgi:hypothetical protein
MQNLIEELEKKAGLTNEQAVKSIDVVADFIKAKFPIFSDAIDKILSKNTNTDTLDIP